MKKAIPWAASAVVAALTLLMLLPAATVEPPPAADGATDGPARGDTVALVAGNVLYDTDLALVRAGDGAVEAWTNDQLLACAAVEAGLENPAVSDFVANRAVQVYLRDQMLDSLRRSVQWPGEIEVSVEMQRDPELYMVERHYYQIILADSAMADSIFTRLSWGQNFQVTARNVSIGQKAGIGGDLGFATGAEMLLMGLPDHVARLSGLSEVTPSSLGWHIFKVDETRAFEDTVRATQSAGQLLYETRFQNSLDSLLEASAERFIPEEGMQ